MFLMTLKASVENVDLAVLNVTCRKIDYSQYDTYPYIPLDAAAGVCSGV